jgi:hypothetical protein
VKVTNIPYASGGPSSEFTPESINKQNVLSDVVFVVAESSEEEAIQPMFQDSGCKTDRVGLVRPVGYAHGDEWTDATINV